MVTYQYRCTRDGPVEITRPIGTAPPAVDCPVCAGPAARVWTAPRLGLADRRAVAAIDRCAATGERPDVVTAPPPRPGRRPATPVNPAWRRLPRP